MTNPSSTFHRHQTATKPPRKRTKRVHEGPSYFAPNDILSENSPPLNAMAQPRAITTNTYVPHASLDTISNKIKKLQSDLGSAATGQLWGPDKQKVLDCKHDVDVLAGMVEGLDVQCVERKGYLNVLVAASVDHLLDTYIEDAVDIVDETTKKLIRDALSPASRMKDINNAVKKGLISEPDVLLDFEVKLMRHLKEALADAVARLVAERSRRDILERLMVEPATEVCQRGEHSRKRMWRE